MASGVKIEPVENPDAGDAGFRNGGAVQKKAPSSSAPPPVIDVDSSSSSSSSSSSDSDSGSDDDVSGGTGAGGSLLKKRRKLNELGVVLPVGFLDPLPPLMAPETDAVVDPRESGLKVSSQSCKQFWKAGDYEGAPCGDWASSSGGMDHVRVHPKFLHSNATSHKWALGAFAELLDNALDEVCNGATYVNIDMLVNKKDAGRMLLIEDNGGGMNPDKMRHCMSLGYSEKSKLANTIGQYGNGFKTSTMRLGADVIVFSRCQGKDGERLTQSIGLLSYTFLRSTGKEDIVVPMLDYESGGGGWKKMVRSSLSDWDKNLETIVQWSPFFNEAELLRQFSLMKDHGTRIFIYNLWEDDQGQLELEFDADPHDIQIRGVNRDEKNIQMAKQFPNSRHFLTYRHSLRSYASILYLRLPPGFRIILRGKDVEHHNIVNDMMFSEKVKYRPQPGADGISKDKNMVADVTIGFVKDAKHHIDVQGFNVYHKNRLIKPFWRLWNAASSQGRGVIGVLEANFVEPAHDKQGFERTTVLSRLEARLLQMQKNYWASNCQKIGYVSFRKDKPRNGTDRENSPDYLPQTTPSKRKSSSLSDRAPPISDKIHSHSHQKGTSSSKLSSPPAQNVSDESDSDHMHTPVVDKKANGSNHKAIPAKRAFGKDGSHATPSSLSREDKSKDGSHATWSYLSREDTESQEDCGLGGSNVQPTKLSQSKGSAVNDTRHFPSDSDSDLRTLEQLREENCELKEKLKKTEGEILGDLVQELQYEKDRCKSLETQLQAAEQKIEELNKEQESLIDIFSEERDRRDNEEKNLRDKLQDASTTIQGLLDKVRLLEKVKFPSNGKVER
ncbi:Histidine kinase-like ATPase, C-terminal domain containing protein [Trema orientale]|uniref:Histidine kinase-like ATPase, C-terminal domain containing protein n=1 Tax=Trema orientale TaxID=63057 RepID=A0A2P5FD45_TREOI|nr:Histidine kinase-like ATPase, C-terminal domain containing protein [Trema orientale]